MAPDQIHVLARLAARRTDFTKPNGKGRTRDLAAAILEHTLRDETDLVRHIDYIHFNPVKHGHVTRVMDWPYSSFHRMVKLGIYPEDWGGDVADSDVRFGERN